MKVIIPKNLALDPDKLLKAIARGMDSAAIAVEADFDSTTDTFKTVKVKFKISKTGLNRTVSTRNEIYRYIDEGTRAHKIRSRVGKTLFFKRPFRAKTRLGYIGSNKGSSGTIPTFAREVNHPGTKPRKLSDAIQKKWQRELPKIVQRSIDSLID